MSIKNKTNIILIITLIVKMCSSVKIQLHIDINITNSDEFHKLPRFWTHTGLCPWGNPSNITEIQNSLLSNDMKMNLELIGSLPNNALSTVRVHWLLQLIDFIGFNNKFGVPKYNFKKLNKFLKWCNDAKLSIGFEFMGDPGKIFTENQFKNVSKEFLWKDLSYQIVQRYLKKFGANKVIKWKFESWNEPDLKSYNLINFNKEDYIAYIQSLRNGLDAACQTINDNIHIKLYGPAGLFKRIDRHPLCWSTLEFCNQSNHSCPIDVITFHRKGEGIADNVFSSGKELIMEILSKYPSLNQMQFSNDEADPIVGWSTPRIFQSDIRYATDVLKIIVQHWHGIINDKEFLNFESISHDNAFLSYWPHTFYQRTLFARFQMNGTNSMYGQFIKKPIYITLGLLGNLGQFAKDVEYFQNNNIKMLTTISLIEKTDTPAFYSAILLFCDQVQSNSHHQIILNISLQSLKMNKTVSIIIEGLMTGVTDPVYIWDFYGRPAYPNFTVRNSMRNAQGPILIDNKILKLSENDENFLININPNVILKSPWIILLRICNNKIASPFRPYNLRIRNITDGEIMIMWSEIYRNERCLRTYEIFYSNEMRRNNNWISITNGHHLPYLSYHFSPDNGKTSGYYRVRGIDVFGRKGEFSKIKYFP